MDCDMYFRSDPYELFKKYATKDCPPIRVVHHNYEGGNGTKMYGCLQTKYSKKENKHLVI